MTECMHSYLPGLPLSMNVSSQGKPTSLFLSWMLAEPDGFDYALSLRSLNLLGSPEGQQLQAHTNESSFEFHGLVSGSRYQLELTVLRPCRQNVTVTLIAQTGKTSAGWGFLVLLGVGSGGNCSRGLAGEGYRESKGNSSQDGEPFVQTLTLLLTFGTAPSVVRGLQLHSSGSPTSLEASWSNAPGDQDSYQLLLYHLESQTLACNISVSPGTLSYNFDNLLPGSQYVLEVITWAGSLQAKTSIHQWTGKVGSQARSS